MLGATMGTADEGMNPLAAERERLRKAGYTETEISQIFVAREAASQHQPNSTAHHGVMSGLASNLAAAGTYARNFIPGVIADVGKVADSQSPTAARAETAVYLGFK